MACPHFPTSTKVPPPEIFPTNEVLDKIVSATADNKNCCIATNIVLVGSHGEESRSEQ